MRYEHPQRRFRDEHGRVARVFTGLRSDRTRLPPHELGRIGGEMARRMVEAALHYLTEQATDQARSSFVEAAFGKGGDVTAGGPKA